MFGKLDKRKGESDEDRALYLNIMEIFAMLLFRSLPPKTLAKFLPKGADLRRYAWTGLNSANPLKQWRNNLGLGTSDGSSFHFSPRQPAARNILFRETDPNLGDLPEAQLMCSYCKDPKSYFTDKYPRYEIVTGDYLLWVKRYCLVCSSTSKTLFVPVDESVTYKHFTTVINRYAEIQAKENVPASVTHAQLQGMKRAELQAWLQAKGYTGQIVTLPPKRKLVSLAKSVQDYLRGPQDQEAERRLQEVSNEHRTSSNLAKAPETPYLGNQRALGKKSSSDEQLITITTIPGKVDVSFLKDLDLSQFPKC